MFKLIGEVTNLETGKALPGARVRILDGVNDVALYQDENMTPYPGLLMSGIDGSYEVWVEDGTYDVVFYYEGDALKTLTDVPMYGPGVGPPGEQGIQGPPGPAGNVAADLAQLRSALLTNNTMIFGGILYNIEPLAGRTPDDVSIIASTIDPNLAWVSSATYVSVKQFGATGNGVTDDTAAVQAFYSYLAANGGEGIIPQGDYLLTSEIVVNSDKPCRIIGSGMRGVYPGLYVTGENPKASILIAAHNGRNIMRFTGTAVGRGDVYHEGVGFTTLETGPVPTACFGWDTAPDFFRNYRFIECSVHGFTSAFDVYKTGGVNTEVGIIHIERCNINRNQWIARTLDATQINGFAFLNNEAGQNGYLPGQGGINVQAHNAEIIGNKLEGCRNPVRLYSSTRSARVAGNYFEACVGKALVHIFGLQSYDVDVTGTYAVNDAQLEHKCLIDGGAGPGRVNGVYWPNGVHKTAPPVLGVLPHQRVNPTVATPLLRLDHMDGQTFNKAPSALASAYRNMATSDIARRVVNPNNGEGIPVREYTTSGAGSIGNTFTIAGAVGQWAVVCWLHRRKDNVAGARADPYISLSINGTGGAGSGDFIPYNHDAFWANDEWCLLTAAVKIGVAMTSLYVGIYPYGPSPAAGRKVEYAMPQCYVVDDPNKIVPYFDGYAARLVTGPSPTTELGFKVGDILNRDDNTTVGQMRFGKIGPAAGDWDYA